MLGAPATAPALASAQTFYVNSTADTDSSASDCLTVTVSTQAGAGTTCTFRGAIDEAEANETAEPGAPNTIEFTVCGPFEIDSQLPTIPQDTAINGYAGLNDPGNPNDGCQDTFTNWYTDPDGDFDTFQGGNYGFAAIKGPGTSAFDGLVFAGAGSSVTFLDIGGFRDAIKLEAPGDDTVFDTFVGNDAYEGGPLNPENTGNGVEVDAGSAHDVIGYTPADGDQDIQDDIYGNGGWGVYLAKGSGPTIVSHNFIGTDTSGDQYACNGPLPADLTCPSYGSSGAPTASSSDPSIPDGNGLGGVYDDGTNDVIGGTVPCETSTDVCTANVIAGNLGPGVELGPDASDDTVASNNIGESLNLYQSPAADAGALANKGPGIDDQGSDDTIGGLAAGDGNTVSGSDGPGILLEGFSTLVENNLVGLNFAGTGASANQGPGIQAWDDLGVSPGDSRILDNTIGGNTGPGVQLDQAGDTVDGNFIGTAGDDASPLPNSAGIVIDRGPQTIGGVTSNPNLIANNDGPGIEVLDPSASAYVTGVDVYDNEIFDNAGLGIDLGGDGVTANHTPDTSAGPDGFANFPVLTAASAANGQWSVRGTIDALPSTYYTIYLYGDPRCDSSGYGPGETFVAGGAATTDANGHVAFNLTGTGTLPPVLSAYDVSVDGTSEFGQCISVGGGASLSTTQTVAGGASVISGEPADIDVNIANAGPAASTNTIMKLSVPPGETISSPPAGCPAVSGASLSCDVGTINAGSSLDVHVILTPSAGLQTLADTVTVTSDQVQLNSSSGSSLSAAVSANPQQPTNVTQPIATAEPTFGEYLRLDRESGTVTAKLPNGQRIDLRNYAIIPVGTVVSTTAGVAKVTAELKSGQTTESDFKFGQFKVAQSKRSGLIDAQMNAPLTGCSAAQLSTSGHRVAKVRVARSPFTTLAGSLAASAQATANPELASPFKPKRKPKVKQRRLWGSDTGGDYRITGNRGAATVQGTTWEVVDTCTTTTVIVYKDSVQVTGFGNTVPKQATVTAGHRIVLRAK